MKVVSLSDYRKINGGFKLINASVVLRNNAVFANDLYDNNKINVIVFLKGSSDLYLYYSALAYSFKHNNTDMILAILSIKKPIDLRIIFEDFFDVSSRLDLLEIALKCLPCHQINPTFFSLISNESINLSLLNVKSSLYEKTGEHAIFNYPEALLYLQNLESRDCMIGRYLYLRDRSGITLFSRMLMGVYRLHANDILGLLCFVHDLEKQQKYLQVLSVTNDIYLATKLLKKIDLSSDNQEDKALYKNIGAYWFFLLRPEVFQVAVEYVDFNNPILYSKRIKIVAGDSLYGSNFGILNTNISFLFEYWAKICEKSGESFRFTCDEDGDIFLLNYLMNDVELFNKYKKFIDLSDLRIYKYVMKHKLRLYS